MNRIIPLILAVALFMEQMDSTVIATALPAIAKDLGMELPHGSAGGGSDANFTGAMGVPTLDGLGVRGADAHTLNEHIIVESLAERGRLMAGLLATLE